MTTPCRAYPHEFDRDPDGPECTLTVAEACNLCVTCPRIAQCIAELDQTPAAERPYGIVAGVHRVWPAPAEDKTLSTLTPKQRMAYDHLDRIVAAMTPGQALPAAEVLVERYGIARQSWTVAFKLFEQQGRLTPGRPWQPRVVLAETA